MAEITVTNLTINGVAMPDPALEGVTITTEKVWSANTGRTASGKMVGSVIAKKTTIKIKWPVLTPEQVSKIEAAVSDAEHPFVPVQYTDMCGIERGRIGAKARIICIGRALRRRRQRDKRASG